MQINQEKLEQEISELRTRLSETSMENSELKEKNSSQEAQISSNSLIISKLKKKLQEKSESIVKLQEEYEILSNSDKKLIESRQLKKEAKELSQKAVDSVKNANLLAEQTRKECDEKLKEMQEELDTTKAIARAQIADITQRCEKDNARAANALADAESYRDNLREQLRNEEQKISELANNRIQSFVSVKELEIANMKRSLECEHKNKLELALAYLQLRYDAREGWHNFIFAFCIVLLSLMAITSKIFKQDVMMIGSALMRYVVAAYTRAVTIATKAAGITGGITNDYAKNALFWILFVICIILLFLVFYGVPVVITGVVVYKYLFGRYYDKVNQWIMIATGIAVIVGSHDTKRLVKCNVILMWLVIQLAVPIVRFVIVPCIGKISGKWNRLDKDRRGNIAIYATSIFVGAIATVIMWRYSIIIAIAIPVGVMYGLATGGY